MNRYAAGVTIFCKFHVGFQMWNQRRAQNPWSNMVCWKIPRFMVLPTIHLDLQSEHCIRIPCIRKWGAVFLPHICFVECILHDIYIYMCTWKLRNWGTLKFKRLRNLDVCERAPLRPCPMFLTMKRIEKVYKDSIWSGKWSQPPLQPNTRQDELCTTTAWLGMISKGGGPTQIRITTWSPRPDTSQTPARLTLGHLYPWLLLPWLALPCLACAALCRGNVTE